MLIEGGLGFGEGRDGRGRHLLFCLSSRSLLFDVNTVDL